MRIVRFFSLYLLVTVFGLLLILFLAENRRVVQLDVLGSDFSVNLAWVLLGAAAFGTFTALVILLPGRIAAAMYAWGLEREVRQVEQDLWQLQAQRERLLARHDSLLEAHERLLFTHRRLIGELDEMVAEHEQMVTEREQIRIRGATTRNAPALPAPQPAREISAQPRVAAAAPTSQVAASMAVPALATVDEPRRTSAVDARRVTTLPPQRTAAAVASVVRPAAGKTPESSSAEPVVAVQDDAVQDGAARLADQPESSSERRTVVLKQEPVPARASFAAAVSVRQRLQTLPVAALADHLRDNARVLTTASAARIHSLKAIVAARLAQIEQSGAPSGSLPGSPPPDRGDQSGIAEQSSVMPPADPPE